MISRLLRNINRDKESLGTKFCSVCIFNRHSEQAFRARIRLFRFPFASEQCTVICSCTKLADLKFMCGGGGGQGYFCKTIMKLKLPSVANETLIT